MEIEPASFMTGILFGFIFVCLFSFAMAIMRPWLRVVLSGGKVPMAYFVGMRIRGNPSRLLIDAYLSLVQSGANVTLNDVESHYVTNKANVFSASDLVHSMRNEPIDTHLAVWLEPEDATWLVNFATNPGAATVQDGDQARVRIAAAAQNSIAKLNHG